MNNQRLLVCSDELIQKKNEIFRNSENVSRNDNVIVEGFKPVHSMHTFRRKLNESLRQSIIPKSSSKVSPYTRETLRIKPVLIRQSIKTETSKKQDSTSQTEAISISINDVYTLFDKSNNIKKTKCKNCKRYVGKVSFFTICLTAYTTGILAFQYYVLQNNY